MRKTKNLDVLQMKKAELEAYNTQFENAVSIVTNAVRNLSRINDGIIEKIKEIDEYQDELSKTRTGLHKTKEKNEQVMKNFNALLGIEQEA